MGDGLPTPGFNLPYGVTEGDFADDTPTVCEDCALLPHDVCRHDGECMDGTVHHLHEWLEEDPDSACKLCQSTAACWADEAYPACKGPYDNRQRPLDGAQRGGK